MGIDPYLTLGLTPDAGPAEIKQAYRALTKQLHPDVNPDPTAAAAFHAVQQAYTLLSDPSAKNRYDTAHRNTTQYPADTINAYSRPIPGVAPTAGTDIIAHVTIELLEAAAGTTRAIGIRIPTTCTSCHGSGQHPDPTTTRRTCPSCQGLKMNLTDGSPCTYCAARGTITDYPCPTCAGQGTTETHKMATITIPAGVDDGSRLRTPRAGAPGYAGGQPGDLITVIAVARDPRYTRTGNDLNLTLPARYTELVLGAVVNLTGLDGQPLEITIPPGTTPGTVLRIPGRGIHATTGSGDLLAHLTLHQPAPPSAAEHAALLALRDAEQHTTDPRAHLN